MRASVNDAVTVCQKLKHAQIKVDMNRPRTSQDIDGALHTNFAKSKIKWDRGRPYMTSDDFGPF